MKLSTLLSTLLVSSAAATAVLETRATNNYTGVVADIAVISAQLDKVTTEVKAFKPNDFAAAFTILSDSMTLENDIEAGTNDSKNSAKFGKKGSNAVAAAILDLIPPIKKSLKTIIHKKPAFDKGIEGFSLSPLVLQTLKNLKSDTDAFGAAVTPKLTKDLQELAPGIIQGIDEDFDHAIHVYGG